VIARGYELGVSVFSAGAGTKDQSNAETTRRKGVAKSSPKQEDGISAEERLTIDLYAAYTQVSQNLDPTEA
jgi:hypothetical protein